MMRLVLVQWPGIASEYNVRQSQVVFPLACQGRHNGRLPEPGCVQRARGIGIPDTLTVSSKGSRSAISILASQVSPEQHDVRLRPVNGVVYPAPGLLHTH